MRLLRVSMLALLCLLPIQVMSQESLKDDLPLNSIETFPIDFARLLKDPSTSDDCKQFSKERTSHTKMQPNQQSLLDLYNCAPSNPTWITPEPRTKTLYLFHFVDWHDSSDLNGPKLQSSRWFAYTRDYRRNDSPFISVVGRHDRQDELFDMTDFVIYTISQIETTEERDTPAPHLIDTIEVIKRKAANVEALKSLIAALTGASFSAEPTLENATTPKKATPKYNYYITRAAGTRDGKSPPFDWKFTARARGTAAAALDDKDNTCFNLTLKSDCTLTRTFSVLDREYWSLGIDIIPRPPLENTYGQTSAGVITRSQPRHSAFYVTADINPFARLWPMSRGPYFQFGLPVTGAALHAPYTGIAQPLGRLKILPIPLSVFGGVIYMKQTFPRTLAVGGTATTDAFAADLRTDRAIKPVFGVEVPLAALIGKVKSGFFK